MGFFAFRTEKNEPIPATQSGMDSVPVYLVRPSGDNSPLWGYDGYGRFSNTLPDGHPGVRDGVLDLKLYMVEANADFLADRGIDVGRMNDKGLEELGSLLIEGDVYRDTETGELWSVLYNYKPIIGGHAFFGNFAQVIPELGGSANDLLENGRLEAVDIRELFDLPAVLKFSYDPRARYEDLPEATPCPDQGLFDAEDLCLDYPTLFVPYGHAAAMSNLEHNFDDDDFDDSPGL